MKKRKKSATTPPTGQTRKGKKVGTDVATMHEPYLLKHTGRKKRQV